MHVRHTKLISYGCMDGCMDADGCRWAHSAHTSNQQFLSHTSHARLHQYSMPPPAGVSCHTLQAPGPFATCSAIRHVCGWIPLLWATPMATPPTWRARHVICWCAFVNFFKFRRCIHASPESNLGGPATLGPLIEHNNNSKITDPNETKHPEQLRHWVYDLRCLPSQ